MKSGRPEAPRDQEETSLTRILREITEADAKVLAAVFVDGEGECVDYCASMEPFDAKVCAATMVIVATEVRGRVARCGHGATREFRFEGERLAIHAAFVSDEYLLVVAMEPGEAERPFREAMDRARVELRKNAEFARPTWERESGVVDMTVGAGEVPERFRERGVEVAVTAVLGRWLADGRPCYRVRTDDGRELTLTPGPPWRILD